jgi:hypothetical protein
MLRRGSGRGSAPRRQLSFWRLKLNETLSTCQAQNVTVTAVPPAAPSGGGGGGGGAADSDLKELKLAVTMLATAQTSVSRRTAMDSDLRALECDTRRWRRRRGCCGFGPTK